MYVGGREDQRPAERRPLAELAEEYLRRSAGGSYVCTLCGKAGLRISLFFFP